MQSIESSEEHRTMPRHIAAQLPCMPDLTVQTCAPLRIGTHCKGMRTLCATQVDNNLHRVHMSRH